MFVCPSFNTIQVQYSWGMLTPDDLANYTAGGFMTADQYKELTGTDYQAPADK
ncbi:XkdX family protein [uncultured Secundilactobacillus sp.]|uniref:XkdX family protein n=1 Tax=uncultured Secundilactobacillus sp. TaxID=2813935 RepID=UPI00258A0492|nr:XkdX family protein [uncultured Secundilactobacillus sp.]